MINAENFKTKIKEQNDKIADEISVHIQSVLSKELEKDEVKVPFVVFLNKQCANNTDIVRAVMNTLGFRVVENEESTQGISVKLDFSSVQNNRTTELTYNELNELLNKRAGSGISSIYDSQINGISIDDLSRRYGI